MTTLAPDNLDPTAFVELVRSALTSLYTRTALQGHPLAVLLGRGGRALDASELQRVLVDSIRGLEPDDPGAQGSPPWRRYRYLWLRYVDGADPAAAADALGVTDRQARRDHREGLEAVAAGLWTRYLGDAWRDPAGEDLLGAELARVAAESPAGPTPLAETVGGALATTERVLEGHGIVVAVDLPGGLPPAAVHPMLLRQAVVSLLAHLVEVGATGQLRLSARHEASTLRLTLRAPAPDRPAGDTAAFELAERLLQHVGGALRRGRVGDAEELAVTLPAAAVTTVLVVDDNLDFLRLCRRSLEGEPYQVVTANRPDDALRIARSARPDLVLLDVLMPTHDGWELLAELKQDEATRHTPVIVCSVFREPQLALELGAVGFLPKPVTPLSLRAELERVLAAGRPPGG